MPLFWLSCLGPLVLLLPKPEVIWLSNLSILSVPEGYSERTWRLFWAYLKVILSVPEGYSERTWRLFWAYLKVILSVPEGYSERTWRLFWAYLKVILSVPEDYSERTWRLFQKHVVRTKLDIYLLLQSIKYSRAGYTNFFSSTYYCVFES
jgi:hypothetical protein